jgi:uncharacterized membrane protein
LRPRALARRGPIEETAMSPLYVWFLFLHVAAALWLAAGVFASAVVRVQGKRASTLAERGLAAALLWRLHVMFTLPGLLVGGFIGFYLVTAGGFRFNEVWVMSASFLFLMMFLSTLFLVTPALQRQRHAAEQAAVSEEAVPRLELALANRLPGVLSDVNALIILVLVFLMVIKP